MIKKRINVTLTEDQWKFICWMARRDNATPQDELRIIFDIQLDEDYWLYKDEMEEGAQ